MTHKASHSGGITFKLHLPDQVVALTVEDEARPAIVDWEERILAVLECQTDNSVAIDDLADLTAMDHGAFRHTRRGRKAARHVAERAEAARPV